MDKLLVSKEFLMNLVITGRSRECFEHTAQGVFDVTELRGLLERGAIAATLGNVDLNQVTPFVREHRVTDQERVDTLPEESWKDDPGIFLVVPGVEGDTHLMIDGHHRALRREKEGLAKMFFHFVDLRDAPRPTKNWQLNPYFDWGDEIVDGVIRKRA